MSYRIITADYCTYCKQAKEALKGKGFEFVEKKIQTPEAMADFKAQGFKTVPQIFLGDEHIGGYSDLIVHLNEK